MIRIKDYLTKDKTLSIAREASLSAAAQGNGGKGIPLSGKIFDLAPNTLHLHLACTWDVKVQGVNP